MVVFVLMKNYLNKESRESGVKNSGIIDNKDIRKTDKKVTINKVFQLKLKKNQTMGDFLQEQSINDGRN